MSLIALPATSPLGSSWLLSLHGKEHRTAYQQHQGDRCTSDQDEQVEKVGVVKTACTTAGTLTSLHSHIACPILDYARIAESGCTSPHKMWKHSWPTRVVFVY